MIIIMIIMIMIMIALKSAVHCAINSLQHVHSSGRGAIVCKLHARHGALITCSMCYVHCGMKEQLGY